LALESNFNRFDDLVVMTLKGFPTAVDLASEYQHILDSEQFVQGMPSIWDCSEIDLKRIPISEVRRLPHLLRQFSGRRGTNYKAAIVTNRGSDFQLLRIYLTILKMIGEIHFRVFRNLEEANLWIKGQRQD